MIPCRAHALACAIYPCVRALACSIAGFLFQNLRRHRPPVERQPGVVQYAPKLAELSGCALHLEQRHHLRVAILLDQVDTVAPIDELRDLRRERKRAQTQVRRVELGLVPELIARFDDGPVRRSVGDEADATLADYLDFRLRHERPGCLELAG